VPRIDFTGKLVDEPEADAFAHKFGAERAYSDHREMLDKEAVDAVFVVVGYDEAGRPAYPPIRIDLQENA
jgi:hypothetical protein